MAPYTPELYEKEPQYHWTSELLDNPDIILDIIEIQGVSIPITCSSDELEELISLKAYNEANDEFFDIGYGYQGGLGVWVPTDTDIKFVVEKPETLDYEFAYWWDDEANEGVSENEVLLLDSSELGVGTDHYFSAVYQEKPEEVELNISADSPHSVSPESGLHHYEVGEKVNISAWPHPGYGFVKWTGDEEAVEAIENKYARKTSIVMDDDYEIEAVFDRLVDLRVSRTEGGSVVEPGNVAYPGGSTFFEIGTEGENINLSAEPENGYKFVKWTGDNQNIDDPLSSETEISLEYDPIDGQAVKAVFEPIIYTLTIDSTEGGYVESPGEGEFEYNYGETVNLRAVPETGEEFAGWTDIDTIANRWVENTTIKIQDNYDVLADFRPVTYMIEYIYGEGSVSDDQGKIVNCRPENVPCVAEYVGLEKVVFTAEPAEGWEISEWWDGGGGQTRTLYTENGTKHIGIEFEPEEEPFFEVEIIAPEDGEEFVVDEEVKLEYVVTNRGSVEDTEDIELWIDRTLWDTKENVTLKAGENYMGSFIETATESGEFNASVHSENDFDQITVFVEEKER